MRVSGERPKSWAGTKQVVEITAQRHAQTNTAPLPPVELVTMEELRILQEQLARIEAKLDEILKWVMPQVSF